VATFTWNVLLFAVTKPHTEQRQWWYSALRVTTAIHKYGYQLLSLFVCSCLITESPVTFWSRIFLRTVCKLIPLVRQCQQALNDISTRHAVGLYCVPGHAGVRGNEIAGRLARSGSVQRFVGPESFLGVSRQIIRRKMKRWMEKQHLALWGRPCSTQRQAGELISGPNLATGARLLFFNRIQSRVVIGLITGHNTLRRHLHIMGGLSDSLTCRKRGAGEESSVHILCECEALASFRHTYLGSFFLDPEDIKVLVVGAIWNFAKGTGLL
jgi:hypothetical protein